MLVPRGFFACFRGHVALLHQISLIWFSQQFEWCNWWVERKRFEQIKVEEQLYFLSHSSHLEYAFIIKNILLNLPVPGEDQNAPFVVSNRTWQFMDFAPHMRKTACCNARRALTAARHFYFVAAISLYLTWSRFRFIKIFIVPSWADAGVRTSLSRRSRGAECVNTEIEAREMLRFKAKLGRRVTLQALQRSTRSVLVCRSDKMF